MSQRMNQLNDMLLPCPFCGHKAEFVKFPYPHPDMLVVSCCHCPVVMFPDPDEWLENRLGTTLGLVEAWNERRGANENA